ncbi:conserved hypothetical protein [Candidatus Koribacter versatilis Ellin345]|uniref:Transcription elongation factor n=1 Tax=Koribacter versatilis (strain Ellin345) TaxID=204669 RepID=Q1INJ2_KORVE|nr:DUF6496 domain-containing protein [Candidatus Koribacter versatilis]ABF41558.1 conserved hypothetical protein [Candidatus Koribacter versatilis Ellin345]
MPEQETLERAQQDKEEGKAPSTQAGEFVKEEMDHIREGKHGARSTKQAIAIGLSKARRAGVPLKAPAKGKTSERTRKQAARDTRKGQSARPKKVSAKRSRATENALKREGRSAASHTALSRQAKSAAKKRSAASRSKAAKKAARTKGATGRRTAAKKAARTRSR